MEALAVRKRQSLTQRLSEYVCNVRVEHSEIATEPLPCLALWQVVHQKREAVSIAHIVKIRLCCVKLLRAVL